MPDDYGYSHFFIERTEEAILRAQETIHRSCEVIRTSREMQADREKIERKSANADLSTNNRRWAEAA